MKNSKLFMRTLAALLAVLLMAASGAPALAASFKAQINSSSAKVYNVPSTSSKTYVQGGRGITVTVTGYANGWARIKYNGNVGYTKISNLNLVNRPKGYTKKSTPVYRQDSASSTRIGTLSAGSAVYVAGVSGNFYRVQNQSGSITGYVKKGSLTTKSALMTAYKNYLASITDTSTGSGSGSSGGTSSGSSSSSSGSGSSSGNSTGGNSSSGGNSSGGSSSGGNSSGGNSSGGNSSDQTDTSKSDIDKVIALAKALIGKPYADSANPPKSFNCSIYVKYCMGVYGYSMKGSAAEQAADTRYASVGLSDLKKGDVLCFDTDEDGKCDHTAIYIGDNKFLEASSSKGCVQQNTLTSWYKEHFLLARRPTK